MNWKLRFFGIIALVFMLSCDDDKKATGNVRPQPIDDTPGQMAKFVSLEEIIFQKFENILKM